MMMGSIVGHGPKTEEVVMKQNREGLPTAILEDKRFFELYGSEKENTPTGWSNPKNWKTIDEIPEDKNFGFVVASKDSNYLFIDFDHVIVGTKMCDFAKEIYQKITRYGETYTEQSMSGTGMHMICDLGDYADDFDPVSNSKDGIIVQMDPTEYDRLPKEQKALVPKVELFYRTGGRYAYLTGRNNRVIEVAKDETAAAMFRELLKIRRECHEKYRKTDSFSADPEGDEHLKADAETLEKAKEALKYISAADYEPWIQIGQACRNIGLPFEVWDEWSQYTNMITGELYPNYDPEETQKKWKSFLGHSKWNAGTIFRNAKKNGYEAEDDDQEQDWSYNLSAWNREHPGEKFDPDVHGWDAAREAGKRAREADKRFDEGLKAHKAELAQKANENGSETASEAEVTPPEEPASLTDLFGESALVDVIADYKNEIPEKKWVIEGICTEGECAIISGSSKSGKSYLMTNLAITAARGWKWLNRFQCKKSRVLYLNGENSLDDARERFHACFDAMGVIPGDCEQITMVCADGMMQSIETIKGTLIDEIRKNQYGICILDPLYCFYSGSEVDEQDAKRFVSSIKEVCRKTGTVVVCVHHHSKGAMMYSNASSRASGSGMLQRAFSTLLDVSEVPNSDDLSTIPDGQRAYELSGQPRQAPMFKINLIFDFPRWYEDQAGAIPDNAMNKGRTAKARQKNKNIQKSEEIKTMLPNVVIETFEQHAKEGDQGEYVTVADVVAVFKDHGIDVTEKPIKNKIRDGFAPGARLDHRAGRTGLIWREPFERIPKRRVEPEWGA